MGCQYWHKSRFVNCVALAVNNLNIGDDVDGFSHAECQLAANAVNPSEHADDWPLDQK